MAVMVAEETSTILSPQWWVDRLYKKLMERRPIINTFDDYYTGKFPLPWLAPQAHDEFRRILKMSRANYTGLVVDAMVERMTVEGFRLNEMDRSSSNGSDPSVKSLGKADSDLWYIWQANNLDTYFKQGLLEATVNGNAYLLVAPNPKRPEIPHIWVEHPAQMIVEYVPGSNRRERAAALKVWQDDWTGRIMATLYLPKWIYKFVSSRNDMYPTGVEDHHGVVSLQYPTWGIRPVQGESSPARNPSGVVPVYELPNNPRLLSGGVSELDDLIDIQDRIVKTIADRLITQDFGAFPQKWASGWPDEDASGNPTPPIQVGQDRMITTEVAETKFGQFLPADLKGYLLAKVEDIKDMASRSRTPAQYLLGEFSNVNGETLKASESGLVAKVRERCGSHDDPLEEAMRDARGLAGLKTPNDATMEVIWRNPEFRTEGELVDSLLKMLDLGVPEEALWERWGASPQEISRWRVMLDDKMRRAAAGDATVFLAERFRALAAGGEEGTGGQSGGQSSANATARRPQASQRAGNRT